MMCGNASFQLKREAIHVCARHCGQLNLVGRTALVSASVSSVGGGLSEAEHSKIPVIGYWRRYLVDRDAGPLEV